MPYLSPGGAFTSAFSESLAQDAALKRQAMLDDLTRRKVESEISLGQAALDEKRTEAAAKLDEKDRAATESAVAGLVPGDIPDAELVARAKKHGIPLRTKQAEAPVGDVPAALASPDAAPQTPEVVTPAGTGVLATPPRGAIRFAGTPKQQDMLDLKAETAANEAKLQTLVGSQEFQALGPAEKFMRMRPLLPKGENIPYQLLEPPKSAGHARVIFDPIAKKYFRDGKEIQASDVPADAQIDRTTEARPLPEDRLIHVTHKDPQTGETVSEWLPQSALRGQTFDAPTSAVTANRLTSAKAVLQTGNDMIASLKDPELVKELGPAMSRYNSFQDFIGNPPPKFAKLAGMIESYSLANMGVHGMRANTGAEAIKATLGAGRHTPESIIATIEGLNGFANHLLVNEGRQPIESTKPTAADLLKKYGGR